MSHRGRKSMASLSIVTPAGPEERLLPPAFLDPEEAAIFADIVASTSPKHFRPSDLPLLCAYVQAVWTHRVATAEFKKIFRANGRPSPWESIAEKAVKQMVALSMRLRLSPQARDKHQPSREQKKLSYYDRAALARHAAASTTCDEGGDGSDAAS